ncbi:GHMP kinase, partial [candidate division KSB1 bacterium]|nr:GHMP kinase [candidate division KSB1 bacterium]
MKKINVSAPGRICLFGEHQDYLGLPVITAAIDLRISIQAQSRTDRKIFLQLPDIHSSMHIDLDQPISYQSKRDYFRSGINILKREGINLPFGFDGLVRGNIPINSGTSSSSALVIAWIKLLLELVGDRRAENSRQIAILAHRAEVLEFNEPGGQMDHFAAAFGGAMYLDFSNMERSKPLPVRFGTFVLGDSQEPKDTVGILKRVKTGTLNALAEHFSGRDIHNISLMDVKVKSKTLTKNEIDVLNGNITNREITQ